MKHILLLLLIFIMTTQRAEAAVAYFIDDLSQAKISSAVVVATVSHSEPFQTNRGMRTKVSIQIEEVLYGDAPDMVDVILYGGTMNGRTVNFEGNVSLQEKERCVLFLLEQENKWYLTALTQSKLNIVETKDYGTVLERNITQQLVYQSDDGLEEFVEILPQPLLFLSEFRKQLGALQ